MASSRTNQDDAQLVIATEDGTVAGRIPAEARDQIQYLCTRLDLHSGGVPFSVGVTSAISGEGVTFISQALAAVLSEDGGRRTCLISTNWWGEDNELDGINPGLAGIIDGTATPEAVLIETRFARLSMIASGSVPMLQRALLSNTDAMAAVLQHLRDRFDHVILDLPAIAEASAALTFGAAADATLLVVRQQMTQIDQVERAIGDLRHSNLLGIVLNDNHVAMPKMLQRRLLDA